jgi:hypothetical protein
MSQGVAKGLSLCHHSRKSDLDSPPLRPQMSLPTPFPENTDRVGGLDRRDFLSYFSGVGLSGTLLPGVLWARIQEGQEITTAALAEAEKVAGLEFSEEEREAMVRGLDQNLRAYEALRAQSIPNELPPAMHFDPVMPSGLDDESHPASISFMGFRFPEGDPPLQGRW